MCIICVCVYVYARCYASKPVVPPGIITKTKAAKKKKKEGRHIFVFACNYLAHTESPVYLSFPGVVGLGHLRVSAGEESSLESVAALHDFAKMVRFSDFLYFLKIDQNRPIFAKLVLGHQRRYSGSVFSYDQGTIHSFQKSWCRIISI